MLILLAVVANLAALVSAQDVKFELPFYRVDMDSTAILECNIVTSKKFEGFFDPAGKKIETGGRYTVTEFGGRGAYQLRIDNVKESDHGNYKCKAEGGAPTDEAVTEVRIRVSIQEVQQLYKMAIGDRGQIKLHIAGYPRPRITWEKVESKDKASIVSERSPDGKVIGDARYSIDAEGSLSIKDVVKTDAGSYRVSSPFKGGVATKTTKVEVGEKPKLEKTPVAKLSVTKGNAIKLDCKFVADMMPTWQHNSTKGVVSTLSNIVGRVQITKESLTISKADRADEGSYHCSGKNTYGETRTTTVLENVITPAKLEPLKNIEVGQGDKLTLNCSATGYPKPSVKWAVKKEGKFVEVKDQKMTPGNSAYVVEKVATDNRGTYKCTAGNGAMKDGKPLEASAEMEVFVLTKPSIDKFMKEVKFIMGKNETKTISCVAAGFPAPTVTFHKDGKAITEGVTSSTKSQTSTAELKYTVKSKADLGSITCMASNARGNVSSSVELTGIVAPGAPSDVSSKEVETTYVEIVWNAPKVTGGDPITKYEVTIVDPSGKKSTMSATDTQARIENLMKDTEYSITVQAFNKAGPSSSSQSFKVKTKKLSLPGSPVVNSVPQQLKTNVLKVSWSRPIDDGGAAQLVYKVTVCKYDSKSGTYPSCFTIDAGTNTSTVVKNLEASTQYKVTVTAHNSRGMGKSSTFKTVAGKSTSKPQPKAEEPKAKERGLSGGAIAGIVIAVILIILIVVDLFCCFFNNCGFTHCCYETFCAGKGGKAGKYEAAKSEEKQELQDSKKPAAETV